jgi:DNA-binding MarR family transcriptional regulator
MTDPARIRQAVYDWVHNDCGQTVKMAIQKHHIDRLVERICNPRQAKTTGSLTPKQRELAKAAEVPSEEVQAETLKAFAKKGRPKK